MGHGEFSFPNFQNPQDGCDYLYSKFYWGATPGGLGDYYQPENNKFIGSDRYDCGNSIVSGGYFGTAMLVKVSCNDDSVFDFSELKCNIQGDRGRANNPLECNRPSKEAGDPVTLTTGSLFHAERDYSMGRLEVSKFYNSQDGFWVHNFSAHLTLTSDIVIFTDSDRGSSVFVSDGDFYSSRTTSNILRKVPEGYALERKDGAVMYFDGFGNLSKILQADGYIISIQRSEKAPYYELAIYDEFGNEVKLLEGYRHQLISITSPGAPDYSVSYNYDAEYGRLISVQFKKKGSVWVRNYHYDSSWWTRALSGISDERGIRYVSWEYLGGKVVQTQFVGGVSPIKFEYPNELTTRVQYELGKWVTYHSSMLLSGKEIVSIEGESSPNCPASNSSYTYNDRGQVLTKTDAKGLITTYAYNDRGLETSRTEASGTSLARTVTTEWETSRFLPVRVVEPDRTTVYSYDTQGRELSRQTTPH